MRGDRLTNCSDVDREAAEMHDDDGLRARREARANRGWRDAKRVGVDVTEDWCGAEIARRVGGTDPGQAGDDYLVAGADARAEERQKQRRRTRVDGDDVRDADRGGELLFERRGLWPHPHPAGTQDAPDRGDFLVAEIRPAEGQIGGTLGHRLQALGSW